MRKRAIYAAILLVSVFFIGGVVLKNLAEGKKNNSMELFARAIYYVKNFYVEDVNPFKLIENAIRGLTKKTSPVAGYVKGDLDAFKTRENLSVPGIIIHPEFDRMLVLRVVKGSDAEKKGIKKGDILTKIASTPTRLMSLWEAKWLLYGPEGTEVEVCFFRKGEEKKLTLKRDFPPAPLEWVEEDVVRIYKIFPSTAEELKKSLKGKDSVIVDLRYFLDGDWEAALELASLLSIRMEVLIKGRHETVKKAIGPAPFRAKVALITGPNCTGACTIFAGILKASGARIFGSPAKAGCGWIALNLLSDAFLIVPSYEILVENMHLCKDGVKAEKIEGKDPIKFVREKLAQE